MQKANGGFTKIGAITVALCCCAGLLWGARNALPVDCIVNGVTILIALVALGLIIALSKGKPIKLAVSVMIWCCVVGAAYRYLSWSENAYKQARKDFSGPWSEQKPGEVSKTEIRTASYPK